MLKNFKSGGTGGAATAMSRSTNTWRTVLITLAVLNLGAAGFLLFPPGGSADDLEMQQTNLRAQVGAAKMRLEQTKAHAAAVEKGRMQGDEFLASYFLERRTAYSTLLSELVSAAEQSKITPKEHAYSTEPVEGSDSLSMMTITANYEGNYENLMRFVHQIDRSPRLLIIEGLNAAPQQGSGVLNVSMKIETFVREDGSEQ
ncbi:MAG: type 4a pilus biogenesis protein PilO [Bryobacteraceae bacterium]